MNASVLTLAVTATLALASEEAPMVTLPVTMPADKAAECMDQTCIIVTAQEIREVFQAGLAAGTAGCHKGAL